MGCIPGAPITMLGEAPFGGMRAYRICGAIIANFSKPVWNRHRLVTGVGLSILSVTVFIVTRQPYAGIVCFAFLVIKGFLIVKVKQQ